MKTIKFFRKVTAVILTLAIAVPCFTFGTSAAYYDNMYQQSRLLSYTTMQILNETGWGSTYVYAKDDKGNELCGSFPGEQISDFFSDGIGRKIQIAILPTKAAEVCINDGKANGERSEIINNVTNGLYRIIDEQDGDGLYKTELAENYGEGRTIWLQTHDGWDKMYFSLWDKGKSPHSPLMEIDITSYPTYKYWNDKLYYMLTVPNECIGFDINNGSQTEYRKLYCWDVLRYQRFFYSTNAETGEEYIDGRKLNTVADVYSVKSRFGDVDLDGEISIIDVTKLQCELADIGNPLSQICKELADVDESGELSIIDATIIQYFLASLIDSTIVGSDYTQTIFGNNESLEILNYPKWDKLYVYAWDSEGNPVYVMDSDRNIHSSDFPGYPIKSSGNLYGTYTGDTFYDCSITLPTTAVGMILSDGHGKCSDVIDLKSVPPRVVVYSSGTIVHYALYIREGDGKIYHGVTETLVINDDSDED